MLKQGKVEWVSINKRNAGSGGFGPGQITVSMNRNGGALKRLVLAIPKAILTAAGMKMNDYVEIKYCDGICQLDRVTDSSAGFKISGQPTDTKGRVSCKVNDVLQDAFFGNGTARYGSPLHETRPNSIQFAIGKEAV